MLSKSDILSVLKSKKEELLKFGVSQIGLFGSFQKNNAKPSSDIDILIDFEIEKETFDNFMKTCDFLEQLFKNQKLDIVTKNGLSPFIGKYILNEVEYV